MRGTKQTIIVYKGAGNSWAVLCQHHRNSGMPPPGGGGGATVTPFVGTGPIVHVLTYQAKVAQTRKAARQTVPVENWKAEHLQELQDD
jgi:hypothetical protein